MPRNTTTAVAMKFVKAVVENLPSIFAATVTFELLLRATLLLFGHRPSVLSLLEHALWAYQPNEPESETQSHLFVYTRWAEEFGVEALLEDCERLAKDITQRVRDHRLGI